MHAPSSANAGKRMAKTIIAVDAAAFIHEGYERGDSPWAATTLASMRASVKRIAETTGALLSRHRWNYQLLEFEETSRAVAALEALLFDAQLLTARSGIGVHTGEAADLRSHTTEVAAHLKTVVSEGAAVASKAFVDLARRDLSCRVAPLPRIRLLVDDGLEYFDVFALTAGDTVFVETPLFKDAAHGGKLPPPPRPKR